MKLVLVQHGRALPKDQDPDRPLSEAGRQRVDALSTFLSQAGELPRRIYHSGKARARQTAETLSVGDAPRGRDDLLPESDPAAFVQEVTTWTASTMVVGHQPFLGKLASLLLTGEETALTIAFQPGTAVCLERDDGGGWSLAWMVRPELL